MNKELFAKYMHFLNAEANRYLKTLMVDKQQLDHLQREIRDFQKKVEESDLSENLKLACLEIQIDVPSKFLDGSSRNIFRMLRRNWIFGWLSLFMDDKKEKQALKYIFTDFKKVISQILFVSDHEEKLGTLKKNPVPSAAVEV
jgi:Na+/phosphate symporter